MVVEYTEDVIGKEVLKMNSMGIRRSAPLIAIGLVVLLVVAGWIYLTNQQNVPESESRIGRILEQPSEFTGQKVVLSGEVDAVIGSRAFTVDAPAAFSEKLLVISRDSLEPVGGSGLDNIYRTDDRVRVQGTVREFSIREVEKLLGADLVDEEFVDWQGKPVIIADSVEENR